MPLPRSPLTTRFVALLGLSAVLASHAPAQSIFSWQGSAIGDWADAANWLGGVVPDATDTTAELAAATDPAAMVLTLPAATVKVGTLKVPSSNPAPSVSVNSADDPASLLELVTSTGQPVIQADGPELRLNARLVGTQGFNKTGNGTLNLRDNPHAHTLAGPIKLSGGRIRIGADQNLGDPENDLTVFSPTTLLADPVDPTQPLVLGAGHEVYQPDSTATLTLANASDAGVLELASPLSGAGPLRFDGVGTLVLSGTSTRTGALYHNLWPAQNASGLQRHSTLKFSGANSVPLNGQSLVFDGGNAVVTDSSTSVTVDLGGQQRALRLDFAGFNTSAAETRNGTNVLIAIGNGTIVSPSTTGSSLPFSSRGANTTVELRLPESTTLRPGYMAIGDWGPGVSFATNSTRVRIGTRANFNLSGLAIGVNGSSGRLDSLAPGSTLRLRDFNGTSSMSSLSIGNFYGPTSAGADAVLDLGNGVLDAQTQDVYIGNGAPPYRATALLRFGAGTLQAYRVHIGTQTSSSGPANFDYAIEQKGGDAFVSNTLSIEGGPLSGNVATRYILGGGNLAAYQINASGTFTGTLRPRLEWSGGNIRNYTANNSTISGSTGGTSTPLEIVLSGSSAKAFDVEAGRVIQVSPGTKLFAPSPEITVAKTGTGTLLLNCQSAGFRGTLRLAAGQIILGTNALTRVLEAGAFEWDAGTLTVPLNSPTSGSSRLALASSFSKTASPAASRVLNLASSTATGTHTLATFASTDLTPADFTASGVAGGYAADFAIGPDSLTVTLAPASNSAFATWRAAKLAASTNLGNANDLADPDGDGRANLLEYALGTEPLSPEAGPPATIAVDPATDRLTLTFSRIADPALTYAVRAADDPSGPWSGEGAETVFTSSGEDNLAGPVTATDSFPLSSRTRRFLRLVVSR